MKKTLTIAICLITALACLSCVTDQSSGGGEAAPSTTVMKVNGLSVTAADLIKAPMMRLGIMEMCYMDSLWAEFDSKGYKIDEAEVEAQMDQARQGAIMSGASFTQMLRDQRTTEADYRQRVKANMAMTKLADDLMDMSDDVLRQAWESEQNYYAQTHGRMHSLTDNEIAALTFEDARETVRDMYYEANTRIAQQELFQHLIDKTELELTVLAGDPDKKFYEDLLINGLKTGQEWPVVSAEEYRSTGGVSEEADPAGENAAEDTPEPEADEQGEAEDQVEPATDNGDPEAGDSSQTE